MTDGAWQPLAGPDYWLLRAKVLQRIRRFWAERDVLEVETPLLSSIATESLCQVQITGVDAPYYLQSAPSIAMKRMLLAGSGDIYQITKAFRAAKQDRKHALEFTILEWYRPHLSLIDMMQEVASLIGFVAGGEISVDVRSYRELFLNRLDLDPYQSDLAALRDVAHRLGLQVECGSEPQAWLNALFSSYIEPTLGYDAPLMIVDWPVGLGRPVQTRMDDYGQEVANRLELYIDGLSLAAASEELMQADSWQAVHQAQGLMTDQRLVDAMAEQDLPCCRAAVGIDRLLMALTEQPRLDRVLAFPMSQV